MAQRRIENSRVQNPNIYNDEVSKDNMQMEYTPLLLEKDKNLSNARLRKHVQYEEDLHKFEALPKDCLIMRQKQTKIMVCITAFNESFSQLLESISGVYRGYYELYGKDEKKINQLSIVIVFDGFPAFSKIGKEEDHPLMEVLSEIGIFDFDELRDYISEKPKDNENQEVSYKYSDLHFLEDEKDDIVFETQNIAHCFSKKMNYKEFLRGLTRQQHQDFMFDNYSIEEFMLGNSKQGKVVEKIFHHMDLDVHFVVKHRNKGKIDSHLWFFKGFWNLIQPEFCFIIDAGTVPQWNSISSLIFYMEAHENVGGASGEIEIMLPEKSKEISFIESVIIRSQYVEYKISHYFDKAAESLFGFVSVLPGAFSVFRWDAIDGEPLTEFLKGQALTSANGETYPSCHKANMYLAEDRIMCLEIATKSNEDYILKFVPGCKALTDGPETLTKLIKQRRRWFNGSLFATFHVFASMCKVWRRERTIPSICRMFLLFSLFWYMFLHTIIGFFIVGLFYGTLSIFLRGMYSHGGGINPTQTANFLENVYLTLLFYALVMSIAVKIELVEYAFRSISFLLGLTAIFMGFGMVMYYDADSYKDYAVWFLLAVFSAYILPLVFHFRTLKLWDFIKGSLYTIFMTPTFINIIVLYSICNIHDVSWGSRPTGGKSAIAKQEKEKEIEYKNYRSNFLLFWLVLNVGCGWLITHSARNNNNIVLVIIGGILLVVVGLKAILSTLHIFTNWWNQWGVCRHLATKWGGGFDQTKIHEDSVFDDSVFADSHEHITSNQNKHSQSDFESQGNRPSGEVWYNSKPLEQSNSSTIAQAVTMDIHGRKDHNPSIEEDKKEYIPVQKLSRDFKLIGNQRSNGNSLDRKELDKRMSDENNLGLDFYSKKQQSAQEKDGTFLSPLNKRESTEIVTENQDSQNPSDRSGGTLSEMQRDVEGSKRSDGKTEDLNLDTSQESGLQPESDDN